MGRTLVIHPGALGDVLLAVPALRSLKAARPRDRLVLAAQPRIGALLAALGAVDASVSFESLGLEALFVEDGEPPRVRAFEGAERIVCWFGARDPVFVRRLAAAAPGAVVAPAAGDGTRPVWEHLLGTVAAAAGSWCDPLAVPAPLEAEGQRVLREAGWDGRAPVLWVHPGAGGLGKRWPAAGFARVLETVRERHRVTTVLNEGPADHDAVAAVAERLGGLTLVVRGLALPGLAGALRQARAYLGNDSGVSHLAAAAGVPSVVLFEAANLAWRPWSSVARPLVVSAGALDPGDVDAVRAAIGRLLA